MGEIVILSGSPSETSRSDAVLRYMGSWLRKEGFTIKHISIKDVQVEVLFNGDYQHDDIQSIASLLQTAKGVVVGSPVYKAAYTGVLKALLDILPQDVLKDTPVFPVMTGGSHSHVLAIEYTLKPVLATLKGESIQGVYLSDDQVDKQQIEQPITDELIIKRIKHQLALFVEKVNAKHSVTI
ncbi:FMN reductase [Pelagirhabdus alkalitolerans]|uniref:FMN reductase n=1 Tax=Pelagirhabdus alkalitolerans TaxID=1612202 RepID=A0A1G6GQ06_9BACI|nr:NADPH-dependent FMN reductase [Pelagirhabdus alkalitolerans]SDB84112.1 FMN reductase [Pelagirhabdus alkalitolerans]